MLLKFYITTVDMKLQKGLRVSLEIAVIRVVISFPPQWNVDLTKKDYSFHNRVHFVLIFIDLGLHQPV